MYQIKKTRWNEIFLSILICSTAISVLAVGSCPKTEVAAAIHLASDPVLLVSNNSQLASSANGGGHGTSDDPYIIENKNIDGGGGLYGISISNTDAHVIVRNCIVTNTAQTNGYSITLSSVRNVVLTKNTLRGNGIDLSYAQDCDVTENVVSDYRSGIILDHCRWVKVNSNTVSGGKYSGIADYQSQNDTISWNDVSNNMDNGIYIYFVFSDEISHNRVYNNFIGIEVNYGSKYNLITKNQVWGNSYENIQDDGSADGMQPNVLSFNLYMNVSWPTLFVLLFALIGIIVFWSIVLVRQTRKEGKARGQNAALHSEIPRKNESNATDQRITTGSKNIEYALAIPPEEGFNKTEEFFKGKSHMTILEKGPLQNEPGMQLTIKNGMTGFSWGETYRFTFRPGLAGGCTVRVRIDLAFGMGAQWMVPSELLKAWALAVGTTPKDIGTSAGKNVWNRMLALLVIIFFILLVFILIFY